MVGQPRDPERLRHALESTLAERFGGQLQDVAGAAARDPNKTFEHPGGGGGRQNSSGLDHRVGGRRADTVFGLVAVPTERQDVGGRVFPRFASVAVTQMMADECLLDRPAAPAGEVVALEYLQPQTLPPRVGEFGE